MPERLDAYDAAVSAPYREGDHCTAVPALTHLRTVPPGKIGRKALGEPAGRPDEPLATWLYVDDHTSGTKIQPGYTSTDCLDVVESPLGLDIPDAGDA